LIPNQPQSGTVQGQAIHLDQPTGLADGTKVDVKIQAAVEKKPEDKGGLKTVGTCFDILGIFVDLAEMFSDF
jgi:hypothetical protein